MKIQELQDSLFDIICHIDDICKQQNISYMLGGGTMLGAVRHKGFIPWDDDADLCIWSEDWPAMKHALQNYLPDYLELVEPDMLFPYFYDFVYRVQNKNYMLHEPKAEDDLLRNYSNRVSVDIFMVKDTANSRIGHNFHVIKRKIIYGLAMGHRVSLITNKYTWLQKMQVSILALIGKAVSIDKILKLQNQGLFQEVKQHKKYCMVVNDLPKYMHLPYESKWFEGTIDKLFCGRLLPVQVGFNEKMSLQYGEYMTPVRDNTQYIQHADCEQ